MTVHVTIEMDEAVKARLDAAALARGSSPDAVVAEALVALSDEDAALAAAVAEARASLDAGKGIPHEEVVARLRARRSQWSSPG